MINNLKIDPPSEVIDSNLVCVPLTSLFILSFEVGMILSFRDDVSFIMTFFFLGPFFLYQAVLKDGSPSDATSCISSLGDATSSVKESDVDQESFWTEQGIYYVRSNYPGYHYQGLLL